MIVQSDDPMADRITPDEPETLVAAFERLAADRAVSPRHVGLFGFSAGASLAFLAATDERIADRVRLVGWLGGYADALELTEQVVARRYDQFDVLHFHIDWLQLPLFSRMPVRFLTTFHGRLDLPGLKAITGQFPDAAFVSISNNQREPLPDLEEQGGLLGVVRHQCLGRGR